MEIDRLNPFYNPYFSREEQNSPLKKETESKEAHNEIIQDEDPYDLSLDVKIEEAPPEVEWPRTGNTCQCNVSMSCACTSSCSNCCARTRTCNGCH
jgi:hypothetical protein